MRQRLFLMLALLTSFTASLCAQTELSWEEKVGQLLMVHFSGEELNAEARSLIQEAHVGGFIYYNWANQLKNPQQVRCLSQQLQDVAKIPLLIAVDQEGGSVSSAHFCSRIGSGSYCYVFS
jgi:beta-N-acetylhexosaminidase